MIDAPIGFFDSGMGGVAVLKTAIEILPFENFIYYGDNGFAPYGSKNREEILDRANYIVDFLLRKKVKAIVIACNTATGVAVQSLREKYDLPIISMEPAVKVGLEKIDDGKILVLATPATLKQDKYKRLIEKLDCQQDVISLPCDGLVELIESGAKQGVEEYLLNRLDKIKNQKIDCVVLGCTHYVFVKDEIQSVMEKLGGAPLIVDGSFGTVAHLKSLLEQKGQLRKSGERRIELFTSGDPDIFFPMMRKALGNVDNVFEMNDD